MLPRDAPRRPTLGRRGWVSTRARGCGRTDGSIGCAYVLPRTTRRSYMMFCGVPVVSSGSRYFLRVRTARGAVECVYELCPPMAPAIAATGVPGLAERGGWRLGLLLCLSLCFLRIIE